MARRRYSPAVEALHREGWEGAIVEGPAAIARFYEGERGAPCPGREPLLARLVRVACWWTGHEARKRLAHAEQVRMAHLSAATPARAP